jgi:hypothetical protein
MFYTGYLGFIINNLFSTIPEDKSKDEDEYPNEINVDCKKSEYEYPDEIFVDCKECKCEKIHNYTSSGESINCCGSIYNCSDCKSGILYCYCNECPLYEKK